MFWCLFCFNRLGVGRKQNGKRQNQKNKNGRQTKDVVRSQTNGTQHKVVSLGLVGSGVEMLVVRGVRRETERV